MPRMAQDTRDERRDQFVRAALQCLEEKSYRDVTVDEVCAVAGFSKGAFYSHFSSKQDLFLALLDEDSAALDALIVAVRDDTEAGVAGIRQFLHALLERGSEARRVQMRADLLSEMLSDPAIRERFSATVRQRRVLLSRWITSATRAGELREVPANALAAILLALSDGLMLHHSLDPEGFRWENTSRALDMILDGLQPDHGAVGTP